MLPNGSASRCPQLNSSDGPFGLLPEEAQVPNVSYAEFGILQAIVRLVPIQWTGTCSVLPLASPVLSQRWPLRKGESANNRSGPLLLWYRSVSRER